MKRYGKERDWVDKESILFKVMEYYGDGAVFQRRPWCPDAAMVFTQKQYERFNIPVNHNICSLFRWGTSLVLDYIDHYDPYVIFHDLSDVSYTDDWCKYTYELLFDDQWVEADPELLETYRYIPGQAEKFFNEFIAKPGTEALPQWFVEGVKIFAEENELYDPDKELIDCEGRTITFKMLFEFIEEISKTPDGEINRSRVSAYLDLSLWAGILWVFGPLSRQFKIEHSEIMEAAYAEKGEVLFYDGGVIDSRYFRKVDRAPQSCYKCSIDAWCVEQTIDDDGVARVICEGCLSAGREIYDGATCGTKFCKYWDCPHNMYHNNHSGAMGAMREHGLLANKAREAKKVLQQRSETLAIT